MYTERKPCSLFAVQNQSDSVIHFLLNMHDVERSRYEAQACVSAVRASYAKNVNEWWNAAGLANDSKVLLTYCLSAEVVCFCWCLAFSRLLLWKRYIVEIESASVTSNGAQQLLRIIAIISPGYEHIYTILFKTASLWPENKTNLPLFFHKRRHLFHFLRILKRTTIECTRLRIFSIFFSIPKM